MRASHVSAHFLFLWQNAQDEVIYRESTFIWLTLPGAGKPNSMVPTSGEHFCWGPFLPGRDSGGCHGDTLRESSLLFHPLDSHSFILQEWNSAVMRAEPSWAGHLQKLSPLRTINMALGVKFPRHKMWGTHSSCSTRSVLAWYRMLKNFLAPAYYLELE